MAETSTIFGFMKYVSATDILSDFKKTVDSHFVNSLGQPFSKGCLVLLWITLIVSHFNAFGRESPNYIVSYFNDFGGESPSKRVFFLYRYNIILFMNYLLI